MKTIITLGPASFNKDIIMRFLRNDVAFRINVAHINRNELLIQLHFLESIFGTAGRSAAVVLDLQGAKMRIGEYVNPQNLPSKISLLFASKSSTPENIPVPHQELFSDCKVGEILLCNDAKVQLLVTSKSYGKLECEVLKNGNLSSFKGINRSINPITYSELIDKDKDSIQIGSNFSFVEYAFSFVANGEESKLLREYTQEKKLIAKIEQQEAFNNLQNIDNNFDELWLCRGDLGAQVGLKQLGKFQQQFINSFPLLKKPKLLAGQVLEHMTNFPEPTRAEVVQLFDSVNSGFNGIVLSDETAIGKHVLAVAEFLETFFKP